MAVASRRRSLGIAWWFAAAAFSASQLGASCVYSAPPLLNYGQGADTLGRGRLAVGGEGGWGAVGSWWKAKSLGDPEVTTAAVGAARLRVGLGNDLDVGLVGGFGPESGFVVGPELKWRFARLAPGPEEDAPGFHAALVSGLGFGAADYRYGASGDRRHAFVAPYTGVLASGGVPAVQMYVGVRFAASETLGNGEADLTLYPVLAFGVQVRPARYLGLFAEGDLAGGITTKNTDYSGLLGYLNAGVVITFDAFVAPQRSSRARAAAPGDPGPRPSALR